MQQRLTVGFHDEIRSHIYLELFVSNNEPLSSCDYFPTTTARPYLLRKCLF